MFAAIDPSTESDPIALPGLPEAVVGPLDHLVVEVLAGEPERDHRTLANRDFILEKRDATQLRAIGGSLTELGLNAGDTAHCQTNGVDGERPLLSPPPSGHSCQGQGR